MAKFRKKLKSKGKRWAKGQSSVTNPESKKYRSQAQMNFGKPMFGKCLNPKSLIVVQLINSSYFCCLTTGTAPQGGKSLLTQNTLKQHDNIMSSYGPKKSKPDDVMSQKSAYTYKTFETFASDWSSCTNPSFNRYLLYFYFYKNL